MNVFGTVHCGVDPGQIPAAMSADRAADYAHAMLHRAVRGEVALDLLEDRASHESHGIENPRQKTQLGF